MSTVANVVKLIQLSLVHHTERLPTFVYNTLITTQTYLSWFCNIEFFTVYFLTAASYVPTCTIPSMWKILPLCWTTKDEKASASGGFARDPWPGTLPLGPGWELPPGPYYRPTLRASHVLNSSDRDTASCCGSFSSCSSTSWTKASVLNATKRIITVHTVRRCGIV